MATFVDASGDWDCDRELFCGTWEQLVEQARKWARPRGLCVHYIEQCLGGTAIEFNLATLLPPELVDESAKEG